MQVSVKGSADKPETWYDEFCSRCPDAALKDKLRKMCGVGSLRTELQQVQLNHMLLNHPAITANISRLLLQVTAKMDVGPVPCQHLLGVLLCPLMPHGATADIAGRWLGSFHEHQCVTSLGACDLAWGVPGHSACLLPNHLASPTVLVGIHRWRLCDRPAQLSSFKRCKQ